MNYELEVRDTKIGRRRIGLQDIPNIFRRSNKKILDENGIVRIGAQVREGDILIGKNYTKKVKSDSYT